MDDRMHACTADAARPHLQAGGDCGAEVHRPLARLRHDDVAWRSAGREHHVDLRRRRAVKPAAERGQRAQHDRVRVALDRVERPHTRHRRRKRLHTRPVPRYACFTLRPLRLIRHACRVPADAQHAHACGNLGGPKLAIWCFWPASVHMHAWPAGSTGMTYPDKRRSLVQTGRVIVE